MEEDYSLMTLERVANALGRWSDVIDDLKDQVDTAIILQKEETQKERDPTRSMDDLGKFAEVWE